MWLYSPQETEEALFHSENRKNIVHATCACIYTSVYYVYSLIPSLHTANDKELGGDLARNEALYSQWLLSSLLHIRREGYLLPT